MFLTFAENASGMYDCTFILSVGLEAFINLHTPLRHETEAPLVSAGSHNIDTLIFISASQLHREEAMCAS